MAETFLYLTTTGRATGKPRQIEIWFVERARNFYLVSEKREGAGWVKNIQRDPQVRFSVGTRTDRAGRQPVTPATARLVYPDRHPELARDVSELMDDKYGWSDGLIVELAPSG